MNEAYSTYEVKARFSEILRSVREGRTVTISYRGEPVAEIRPIGGRERRLAQRLGRLEDRGVLRPPAQSGHLPAQLKKRPGALGRFLEDRDA